MSLPDPRAVGVVAVGGAVGAVTRHTVVAAVGAQGALATLVVNTLGAFLLGLLLERLARSRLAASRRERLRLLLATGALGGFTTYSGIAVEVWERVAGEQWVGAVAYGLGTVACGLAACGAGVVFGSRGRDATR